MDRVKAGGYSELITAAYAVIPEAIHPLIRPHFLCGTDPIFAGIHRFADASFGRSYTNTWHVAYPGHQLGVRSQRHTTVVCTDTIDDAPWVRQRFGHYRPVATDVVLDFDDLVEQLAGDRYDRTPEVLDQARAEWSTRLPAADWVIWTAPCRRGRFRSQWNAQVIVVTASMDECLRRASVHRPHAWQAMVRRWFVEWEPSRSGSEQTIDTTCGSHN